MPSGTALTPAVMTAGLVSSQFCTYCSQNDSGDLLMKIVMYGAIKNALGARPGLEIHADEPVK